jgi:hypothetical protein
MTGEPIACVGISLFFLAKLHLAVSATEPDGQDHQNPGGDHAGEK